MKPEKSFFPKFNDSIWLMIRLAVVTFMLSIPVAAVYLILQAIFKFDEPAYRSILILINYALPFIIVIQLGIKRIRLWSMKEFHLSFSRMPLGSFLLIILTGLALMVVLNPIESLIPMPEIFIESYLSMMQMDAVSFLTVVIAAPLLEEILFRGIILEGFLHNYSPRKAILLSALIFALVHLNPLQMIGAFFIGIFLGWVYWRTRTLLPVIGLHFLNNLISFLYLMQAEEDVFSEGYPMENPAMYWIIIGLAALTGGLGVRILNQRMKKIPAEVNEAE